MHNNIQCYKISYNPLTRYSDKKQPATLKKIGNFFSRFFTIIKMRKPCKIVDILLIEQNQTKTNSLQISEIKIQNLKSRFKIRELNLKIQNLKLI